MIRGLLNGAEELQLQQGGGIAIKSVTVSDRETSLSFTLEKRVHEVLTWSREVAGIWADPRLEHSDATHVDYKFEHWSEAGTFVLAGSRAVLMDEESGGIWADEPLVFVEFSASMEILEFRRTSDGGTFVVVSSGRVVAFSKDRTVRWRFDTPGVVRDVIGITDGELILTEYDKEDPTLPGIQRRIDLISGFLATSRGQEEE